MRKGKRRFVDKTIYLWACRAGLLFLLLSFFAFKYCPISFIYDLLTGLGCGFLSSGIVSFAISKSAEKIARSKRKNLTDFMLDGIPFGVFLIAKYTIEFFGDENSKGLSLKECFDISIEKCKAENSIHKGNAEDAITIYRSSVLNKKKSERERFLDCFDAPIKMMKKGVQKIKESELFSVSESLFTPDDIALITNNFAALKKLRHKSGVPINEILDLLKPIIESFEEIPALKKLFNKQAIVVKHSLENMDSFYIG